MFSMYMITGAPLQATNVSERRAIIGDIISSHFEEKAGATCTQTQVLSCVESSLQARNLGEPCLSDFSQLPERLKKKQSSPMP